ncbi:hypothetical protein Tco_0871865 [Tanacetum coccineum]
MNGGARCDTCKILVMFMIIFLKKWVSPPIGATSSVVLTLNDEKQMMVSPNGGVKEEEGRYEPKATTSAPMKGTTYVGYTSQSTPMLKTTGIHPKTRKSLCYSVSALISRLSLALEEERWVNVEKCVIDESANLIQNTKAGGSSSFTAVAG